MWALQLHLCWMRPWLGCLWKGPTEGNAKGYETESAARWCQTYVQAAKACRLHLQGGASRMKPSKTVWSLLKLACLFEHFQQFSCCRSEISHSRKWLSHHKIHLWEIWVTLCLSLWRPPVWTEDVKNAVPIEEISPPSGETSDSTPRLYTRRPTLLLIPSSFSYQSSFIYISSRQKGIGESLKAQPQWPI